MESQIRISLRPNNQITLTKGRWRKKEIEVTQSVIKDFDRISDEDRFEEMEKLAIASRLDTIAREYRSKRPNPPLDIILKSQRKKKAPCMRLNTPKNFTRFSGQKILESGSAMEIASNNQMRFCHEVTLTLPANMQEAFKALAAYSGYIINRLFQLIRRNYGDSVLWFFVWEYQERGALHLHIALYHPDESEGLYISALLIEQWNKILSDVSIQANTDMFAPAKGRRKKLPFQYQHHAQPLQKSVASYFAKYAGKEESKNDWYVKKYPVSRFWGSSKRIKEIIKNHSMEFNFDYQGNEKEAVEKFQEIVNNVIEKLAIVSASKYSFDIQLQGKTRLNRYQNGRKILSIDANKSIARGDRYTFYFNRNDYRKAMELIQNECGYF